MSPDSQLEAVLRGKLSPIDDTPKAKFCEKTEPFFGEHVKAEANAYIAENPAVFKGFQLPLAPEPNTAVKKRIRTEKAVLRTGTDAYFVNN
jgi:hypothetical protein